MSTEEIKKEVLEILETAKPQVQALLGTDNNDKTFVVPVVVVVISGPIMLNRESEKSKET